MKEFIIITILLICIGILFSKCRKQEFVYSESNADEWMPTFFKIEHVSITEKKLSWQYNNEIPVEGFRLDKKIGDGEWINGYQFFTNDIRTWNDIAIIPDGRIYEYRIQSFVGDIISNNLKKNIEASIPKPTNLKKTVHSTQYITVKWNDNSIGELGFQIERRIDKEEWQFISVTIIDSIFDSSINLELHSYKYRVKAFYINTESDVSDEIQVVNCDYPIQDYDGNIYNTVFIESQCWMKENLNSKHDARGNTILRYCYDDIIENCDTFGGLYNWHTIMNKFTDSMTYQIKEQGICPDGWHLPCDYEWSDLVDNLHGEDYAGIMMKDTGTLHWRYPNSLASNTSGFTALPGGFRASDGRYLYKGYYGQWTSTTLTEKSYVLIRELGMYSRNLYCGPAFKDVGLSVRCIKD